MGGPDVLALLTARGLSIRPLPGGLIEVSPRDRLTDQLRDLIRAHRAEILTALGGYAASAVESSREAKLAELRRLILDLAAAEPEHWTPRDIAEALAAGEKDLGAAISTWWTQRRGIAAPSIQAEARRRRVLDMLGARPVIRYALVSDPDDTAYPESVVLAVGVRKAEGALTFEMLVPRERYDPFLLIGLVERHVGPVHCASEAITRRTKGKE